MIRVLLVDDHRLFRQGVAALLHAAPDMEVVGETGQGTDALALAHTLRPDVVLLDINLPECNGVETARTLRQEQPEIAILILTAYPDAQYVYALMGIGVQGYLLKTTSGPDLIAAIRMAQQGKPVLSPEIARQIATRSRRSGIAAGELSERERAALVCLAQGKSNKEIAALLTITARTVESHLANAMAKLGARSRTEAVILALQQGLISLDDRQHE